MALDTIDDFHRPVEVAKILKVDIRAVRAGIKTKEIPAIRVGKRHRIPGAWLRRAAAMTEAA